MQQYQTNKVTLPGFGHRAHKPDDPRSPVILDVAREVGCNGSYVALLNKLSAAVDAGYGKHLTINATGAIAAVLLEIGVPPAAMRGIAVISRAGGLLGHILEEQNTHAAREIWKLTRENIAYKQELYFGMTAPPFHQVAQQRKLFLTWRTVHRPQVHDVDLRRNQGQWLPARSAAFPLLNAGQIDAPMKQRRLGIRLPRSALCTDS